MNKSFLVFLFLIITFGAQAQVDSLMMGIDEAPAQPLLPEKMGFVKKAFWGEHGLMRTLKISQLTPEGREKELRVRHTMLKLHQYMGMVTVGSLLTTIYFGQKIKSGDYSYVKQKDAAAIVSVSCYAATGLLQLLSPPPLIIRKSKGGWSSIKAHRTLAYIHFTGMIVTPILGVYLHNHGYETITYHQVSGIFTTAALASAMIVMKF